MLWRALRTSRALLLPVPVLALALSCTLAVDTEELQAGAAGLDCGLDAKVCPDRLARERGTCVLITNTAYGCGAKSCSPCAMPNATARCDNDHVCRVGTCEGRYKNCNGKDDDGCEADLDRDERNCGACDNQCSTENGVTACSQGQCLIVYCSEPLADCDGRYSNGCETDTRTSSQHCGKCNNPCAGSCEAGVCNP
jgi:hypothetical protein